MSRLRHLAKIIVKFDFLVRLIRSIFIQVQLYAPSENMNLYVRELSSKQIETIPFKERIEQNKKILENLRLLKPNFIDDSKLIRVGPEAEGGYVLYNNVAQIDSIISIGVAKDTAFEEDFNAIAPGKPQIHLFDHTDKPLRKLPGNFHFHSQGIGSEVNFGKSLITLTEIIDLYIDSTKENLLKIDIDGSEYSSLKVCTSNQFQNFGQIIIEFHELAEYAIFSDELSKILTTLLNDFFVIHLHPNNFEPWKVVNGFSLPNVLEVTFLNNRFRNEVEDKIKTYPTPLDFPNDSKFEMILGSFIY